MKQYFMLTILQLLALPLALFATEDVYVNTNGMKSEYFIGDTILDNDGIPHIVRSDKNNIWKDTKDITLSELSGTHEIWFRSVYENSKFKNPYLFYYSSYPALEFYLNDACIYRYGSFAADKKPEIFRSQLHTIHLKNSDTKGYIYVRVLNSRLGSRIFTGSYLVDTADPAKVKENIYRHLLLDEFSDLIFSFLFLSVGFISLLIFFLQLKRKNYILLFLGLFFINIVTSIIADSPSIIVLFDISPTFYFSMGTAGLLLYAPLFLAFYEQLLPQGKIWLYITITWKIHIGAAAMAILLYNVKLISLGFFENIIQINILLSVMEFLLAFILCFRPRLEEWEFIFFRIGTGLIISGMVYGFINLFLVSTFSTLIVWGSFSMFFISICLVTVKRITVHHDQMLFLLEENEKNKIYQLQKEMNPHFLFNSLDSIHYLIEKDSKTASDTLVMLSDNYRFLLQKSHQALISLEEAWSFLRNYIAIEKVIQGDRLSVRVKQEGDMSDVMLPPLSFQPLVENAIKHGFRDMSLGCILSVSLIIEKKTITFTVSDNGRGIDKNDAFFRSLGNIAKRIQYYYNNATLTLENQDRGGATVQLIIPG